MENRSEPSQASASTPLSRREGASASLAVAGASVIDLDASMLIQLGIFLLLFLILRPLLFRRLVDLFAAREKSIEGAQAEAREMEEESKKKTVAYEDAMKKVRAEAAVERDALRADATKAAAAILVTARDEAGRRLDEGKRRIRDEAGSIRTDLTARAKELGMDLSRRVLGRDPGGAA